MFLNEFLKKGKSQAQLKKLVIKIMWDPIILVNKLKKKQFQFFSKDRLIKAEVAKK